MVTITLMPISFARPSLIVGVVVADVVFFLYVVCIYKMCSLRRKKRQKKWYSDIVNKCKMKKKKHIHTTQIQNVWDRQTKNEKLNEERKKWVWIPK